jgi:hypothetical protein
MFTRAKKVLDAHAVARQANHRPTQLSAMKSRIFATALLLIVPTIRLHNPTRDRRATSAEPPAQSEANLTRDRVISPVQPCDRPERELR